MPMALVKWTNHFMKKLQFSALPPSLFKEIFQPLHLKQLFLAIKPHFSIPICLTVQTKLLRRHDLWQSKCCAPSMSVHRGDKHFSSASYS